MTEETRDKTTEGAEANAFLELAPKAVDEHIKFEAASIAPGFVTFVSDVDVEIGLYRFRLPAGIYLLKSGEEVNEARVYTMTFNADELLHAGDGLPYEETTDPETGVTMRSYGTPDSEPITFSATIEPLPTREGEFLTYLEYVAWLTMTVAPDNETRNAIFNSAYHVTSEEEVTPEDIPQQDGKKPKRRYDPVTKLHQNMTNPALYDTLGVALNVAGRGEIKRGKTVETLVSLEYIGDDGVTLSRVPTEFEQEVYNAVCSVFEAGKTEFTLQEIFELTMGAGRANPEQLERIEDAMEVWRRVKLKADVTQEAKAHKLIDPETGKPWELMEIDDFLLNVMRIRVRNVNGKETMGYKFHDMPMGLRYAKASKKLVSFETKYLDTKSAGSNTERNVVTRGYLLRRIKQAEGGKMSPVIRCETIYNKAGINKESRTERNRLNTYITNLMDLWQEQGLISGYRVIGEGRQKMAKVEVFFHERPKRTQKTTYGKA